MNVSNQKIKDIVDVREIWNTADDGITPSHTKKLYEAVTHENKELHWIKGANHYYFGQPEKSDKSADICLDWLDRKNFLSYWWNV